MRWFRSDVVHVGHGWTLDHGESWTTHGKLVRTNFLIGVGRGLATGRELTPVCVEVVLRLADLSHDSQRTVSVEQNLLGSLCDSSDPLCYGITETLRVGDVDSFPSKEGGFDSRRPLHLKCRSRKRSLNEIKGFRP